MRYAILALVILMSGCVGLDKTDVQSALNATEIVGQTTADNAVIICNVAEEMAVQSETPASRLAQVRLKCDALYSVLEALGAAQNACQVAINSDDLGTAKEAYERINALILQAKTLFAQIAGTF